MMSVVHRLTAGWLVDHLSFINQCGYEICDSFAYPDDARHKSTSGTSTGDCRATSTVATTSSRNGPIPGPGDPTETEIKTVKMKYVFREEFFDISKPHIASALEEQLWQGCPELSLTNIKANSNREEHQEGTKSGIGDSVASARKKRKRKSVFNQGELDALEYHSKVRKLIWEGTLHLVQEGLKSGFLHHTTAELNCRKNVVPGHIGCGLAELCEMAKQFPDVNESDHQAVHVLDDEISIPEQDLLSCVTENSSNCAKIVVLMGQKYLVPPKSSFLLSDISCLQPLLNYKKKYDVIVIDPPWENKSIKRSNRYSHLPSWQIKQIPVPALAVPNCLVVTWVTNRQKHLRFVKDELYPHWSVKTLAEWHWVKITRAGEFVLPLDSLHKKPYEVLVLGRVEGDTEEGLRKPEDVLPIPERKLIVSIPSSLHSHKPPLTAVLAEFVKPDVECLELFARNLQPGWTSWGNEVLKFQHTDYFTLLQNEN
ncbi:N(6)-adenine-specific methyltransferase METTL4 isoform X1 [Falco peregrinus]|uniref:N(6)-adenine-specific methyltransferase METTL4 isoform X1 n=1 Tax=Falco peregrinus TaxID=8954 RepID=UPI002479341B|nr:N(6)-adenine-specific methyltransferase METTL4 isoform X1 [Falco peregrinus]XP_055654412.1 N(6)-adenine-specific methyltransferase METTL4 isoform X1 [Falco peregrinus]XP_055654413.1 N(6)-adenine-specific methyltransferase METTL4 isoform X1 [Falco peregrinus]